MALWSTEPGGGELTIEYDLEKKIQVYESFCAPGAGVCLYTSVNPAFLAPEEDDPNDEYHRIADGTRISIEIVAIDAALTLAVSGNRLNSPGARAGLGTMPNIHNHPSWQVLVPEGERADYHISYKLSADASAYRDSQVFSHLVTNAEPTPDLRTPTPSPTPTATPIPPPCPGDCNRDGTVTVDEVVLAVGIALGSADLQRCPKLDQNGDGLVTIDEILLAVNATVNGCPLSPTPIPATFARIQETIFTPTCLDLGCHNARDRLGDLVLEAGVAYDALVGVAPANFAAAATGFLRVDPERPETSFLLTKVTLPRPEHGSLMPLGKPPLTADQVQLIRDWILQGALR